MDFVQQVMPGKRPANGCERRVFFLPYSGLFCQGQKFGTWIQAGFRQPRDPFAFDLSAAS